MKKTKLASLTQLVAILITIPVTCFGEAHSRQEIIQNNREHKRLARSPLADAHLLMSFNELRVSGSKSEPPSRPSVDWSKQRPYFGPDMVRNVSVELGKTAYLTCKVYELGDKTVSWLRPRENEILTAGRYTYIGDSRFASINDNGSHDWILEIKDVGLNDSTSYECQVSTDPKMSTIINLQVKETNKNGNRDRHHQNGYHGSKEAQRNRLHQHNYNIADSANGLELSDSYSSGSRGKIVELSNRNFLILSFILCCLRMLLSLDARILH